MKQFVQIVLEKLTFIVVVDDFESSSFNDLYLLQDPSGLFDRFFLADGFIADYCFNCIQLYL